MVCIIYLGPIDLIQSASKRTQRSEILTSGAVNLDPFEPIVSTHPLLVLDSQQLLCVEDQFSSTGSIQLFITRKTQFQQLYHGIRTRDFPPCESVTPTPLGRSIVCTHCIGNRREKKYTLSALKRTCVCPNQSE